MQREQAVQSLREAWHDRQLTLYLGAGVSVANGLPTWERLVVAMYFDLISRQKLDGWRPFANYLYAIAEWHLERVAEPLEITARRLRSGYERPEDFLSHLQETLYAGLWSDGSKRLPDAEEICSANPTLDAVRQLCMRTTARRGISGVITYNYDALLEHVLGAGSNAVRDRQVRRNRRRFEPIWGDRKLDVGICPIYHVHGYVPPTGDGSSAQQIVFTEDQYNLAAADPYAWQNLVQLSCFSGSTGLMVGLSLSDRNMRRLLDAVMRTPGRSKNFVLMKRPVWPAPTQDSIAGIDQNARAYFQRFERSGVKSPAATGGAGQLPPGVKGRDSLAGAKGPRWEAEIRGILRAVESNDVEQQTEVLSQLGICPIWYDEHAEIPEILRQVQTS